MPLKSMIASFIKWRCLNPRGQSVTELAIFGSILIFVISLIFRQGLSAGNFMSSQLQATRYAMSKSLEKTSPGGGLATGRNSASALIIEDRLSGDFSGKQGTRDRIPIIASGNASFTSQMFQPLDPRDISEGGDFGNPNFLPHQDVVINGQFFSFTTAAFKTVSLPTSEAEATALGILACGGPHPNDTRCWDAACDTGDGPPQPKGCVVLQRVVQNYPGSGFDDTRGGFDFDFDGTEDVTPGSAFTATYGSGTSNMAFMWQWRSVAALGEKLPQDNPIDVDGDFHEEQILDSGGSGGRITWVKVIDRQDGDLNFTIDDRQPDAKVGLQEEAQMFSFTRAGTYFRIEEGKLFGPHNQYIRNMNRNDHVDIVQRTFQLSNNTGRFCDGSSPRSPFDDGANPVEACNNCFSPANIQKTCLDVPSLKLFVRSRVLNEGGRSWFTRTEVGP